jgi:hypothetical protein
MSHKYENGFIVAIETNSKCLVNGVFHKTEHFEFATRKEVVKCIQEYLKSFEYCNSSIFSIKIDEYDEVEDNY